MSNDKTTLADVQPGGRVRLGDQAEKARFEQHRGGDFELDAQGYYTNPRTAQDWAMWQAAIAARQPVGEQVGYVTFRDGRFGSCLFQTREMAESHDSTAVAGGPGNSEIVPLYRSPAQAVDLDDFKALYRAYVRLLESGRDRIRDLGGACDPVDVMEANDVDLQAARRVLDRQAVGNG
ncbi:hypothetical protein [Stenotrophomonas maltophilia]|uniref:hypothetical protein n=1 Tax=Stenotrophomonas maltophilia TaxID=40324 RepID=UPI000B40C63F|nr:hypothetical protein [Stenotrophomonas maltophilia]OWB46087.1 hypothetical protein B7H27_11915 [Stenotrophomonas maltophilia]